jgi:hypothetical protein
MTGPGLITVAQGQRFAEQWLAAWNDHDLDEIMSHYGDCVTHTSPYVPRLGFDPSGTIRDLETLRRYHRAALERDPGHKGPHFERVGVLIGATSVTVLYRTYWAALAAEVMVLSEGKITAALCHYGETQNP